MALTLVISLSQPAQVRGRDRQTEGRAAEDIEEFGLPLRKDTVLPAGYKKLDDLKTIRPTIAEIIKGIPELTEKWRDTFGV